MKLTARDLAGIGCGLSILAAISVVLQSSAYTDVTILVAIDDERKTHANYALDEKVLGDENVKSPAPESMLVQNQSLALAPKEILKQTTSL